MKAGLLLITLSEATFGVFVKLRFGMLPMRTSRYQYSEKLNPWMAGVGVLAPRARERRKSVFKENPLIVHELKLNKPVSTHNEAATG